MKNFTSTFKRKTWVCPKHKVKIVDGLSCPLCSLEEKKSKLVKEILEKERLELSAIRKKASLNRKNLTNKNK